MPKLRTIQQAFAGRPVLMGATGLDTFLQRGDMDLREDLDAEPVEQRGSVAVVRAHGVLVDHPGWWDEMFGGVIGYETLLAVLSDAVRDADVDAVILSLDSPGGSAGGAFQAAEGILRLRGQKPIVSLANSVCNSAAYLVGSACDMMFATPGAQLGSLGALIRHVNISKMLDDAGVKVETIGAGKRKGAGDDAVPLDEETRGEMQEHVTELRDMFCAAVSRYRGLDMAKLVAQESRIFLAPQALTHELIDGIRTLDELVNELSTSNTGKESRTMSIKSNGRAQVTPAAAAQIPDTLEAVLPAYPGAVAAIQKQASEAARLLERGRIAELRGLAKDGFEAELAAAIESGATAAEFCVSLRKAELANPAKAQLGTVRADAQVGVPSPRVDVLASGASTEPAPSADDDFEAWAKAAWETQPEIRKEFKSFDGFKVIAKSNPKAFAVAAKA